MNMQVISRDDLESISSVEIDGVRHHLGIVKDFHRHEALAKFVPDVARLSQSWVHLSPGQELAVHAHPTKSMIIVAEGAGQVIGDVTGPIRAGDVVIVPENARHGFIGSDPNGFWALSVQFEGSGLYENTDSPRVTFEDQPARPAPAVSEIIEENRRCMDAYDHSALVELVRNCRAGDDDHLAERILDHLQPWSNEFQRIMAARAAAEQDPSLGRLAHEHLAEEIGHNQLLQQSRNGRDTPAWDPVITATAAWFVDRMYSASSVERTVLAHLVLEGSGLVFHSAGNLSFPGNEYFSLHDSADVEHLEMGYRALAERDDWNPGEAIEALRRGWQMMTLMCDRIAERVVAESGR